MAGKIITKEQFLAREDFYLGEIKKGKIFIYPTDTIYGIGCDATNGGAIKKIREIKQRDARPFSVIVPSKNWIMKNCEVHEKFIGELGKLPGKFTLILSLKNKKVLAQKELVGEMNTLGVRMPLHWFAEFLSRHDLVFVTTSVNISGQNPLHHVNEISEEIEDKVNYIIDDGKLLGHPSTLIDLSKEEKTVTKR